MNSSQHNKYKTLDNFKNTNENRLIFYKVLNLILPIYLKAYIIMACFPVIKFCIFAAVDDFNLMVFYYAQSSTDLKKLKSIL